MAKIAFFLAGVGCYFFWVAFYFASPKVDSGLLLAFTALPVIFNTTAAVLHAKKARNFNIEIEKEDGPLRVELENTFLFHAYFLFWFFTHILVFGLFAVILRLFGAPGYVVEVALMGWCVVVAPLTLSPLLRAYSRDKSIDHP